jgi:hypothetical protein
MTGVPEVTVGQHEKKDGRIVIELPDSWILTNFHDRGNKTYVVVKSKEE